MRRHRPVRPASARALPAELNGFDSPEAFKDAIFGIPFLVTMIGFVPGLTWGYQLVTADRQIFVSGRVIEVARGTFHL